ncbi:unnamed protein product, partial [marine sediment metagenome]
MDWFIWYLVMGILVSMEILNLTDFEERKKLGRICTPTIITIIWP